MSEIQKSSLDLVIEGMKDHAAKYNGKYELKLTFDELMQRLLFLQKETNEMWEEAIKLAQKEVIKEFLKTDEDLCEIVAKKYGITIVVPNGEKHG